MRAVVQRVRRAEVRDQESGEVLGKIGVGLCVLLGIGQGDGAKEVDLLVDRITGLRIFPDSPGSAPEGRKPGNINRALREVGGALLVVSQFTLYADTSRGRRPSFLSAMPPAEAIPLYERFLAGCRSAGFPVEAGRFGAMMDVELCNDGPVTIWFDTSSPPSGS
ncbi:MAG: D-tyrosyl-tRNA(Tyr) deacylase [Myxococcales bacterium]|jgi:D-tyrosyl-tRNA(Tyr) deacylase|nr:D-tyrosyl-tRNA(Tyr) deacylase [Myxococcales bacterium]